MDFSSNPYATVLIPEPMDYFAACAATSMCEAKCSSEFTSFDRQLALEAIMHSSDPVMRTIEKTTESLLFVDLDEDAYTPMNIMAMVELSDCKPICGGTSEAATTKTTKNKDTCIAIAGLPSNNTIAIRKYCVPKAQGRGVRGTPTETWFVWYSEEWTDTLVDLKFLDTVSGDAVIALRDNKGRSLSTGPLEQFVTVHPRRIQQDTILFDRVYGSSQNRIDRLMLVSMSSEIEQLDSLTEQVCFLVFQLSMRALSNTLTLHVPRTCLCSQLSMRALSDTLTLHVPTGASHHGHVCAPHGPGRPEAALDLPELHCITRGRGGTDGCHYRR